MITSLSIGRGGLGRFGNQMFTMAGVIGIAIKSGQPFAFPRWKTYDNPAFGLPIDDIEEHLLNELPRIPDGLSFNDYGYFWGYRDINLPTGNWSIDAHMQSYKFFIHCIDKVREVFRFKDEPPQNEMVAIHYRAGDYTEGKDTYHPRQTKEYYDKAMAQFPDGKFILFSDDTAGWCQMMGIDIMEISSGKDYIEDFKMMKRCKSFIIANSSFSLMAALLGDHPEKKIVCPKLWFGSVAGINGDDCYPENAIVL